MYDEDFDEVCLNPKKSSKHSRLISQLKDFENDESDRNSSVYMPSEIPSFLPSNMLESRKKGKKKNKGNDNPFSSNTDDPDEWANIMMNMRAGKSRSRASVILDEDGNIIDKKTKKKKKKKTGKNEPTDFAKKFETEMALYQNLLRDQNNFTNSLQREYDMYTSHKSSSRGMTKNITDLISNVISSRQLSVSLIEKTVNLKKLISELTMKEKKELGLIGGDGEDGDINNYASSYLKKMIDERQALTGALNPNGEIYDYNDDDVFDALTEGLMDSDRDSDADIYLKYENRGVKLYAYVKSDDINDFELVAKASDGEIIDEYPKPNLQSIDINRSTNIATDDYGTKYPIIWK